MLFLHKLTTVLFFSKIELRIRHGQSSYWTAKSSFPFFASDHTEADPNYTLGVDFWTKIFFKSKKFRFDAKSIIILYDDTEVFE